MKKILFVLPKFSSGGAEKSLLMLLYALDKEKYKIDLLLFKQEGIFLEQLPSNVRVLDSKKSLHNIYSKTKDSNFKLPIDVWSIFVRCIGTLVSTLLTKNENQRNQIRWKWFYKYAISKLEGNYDIACAFLDGEPIYYVIDKVNAKIKYGWNQNDYDNLGLKSNYDRNYFEKLDKIITLSDKCENILCENFSEMKHKILQIPPIVSKKYIIICAKEFSVSEIINANMNTMVSVGRLVEQKGFDLGIEAAARLKNSGIIFQWFIIGEGELRSQLEKQIVEKGLQNEVILLGEKSNPYPYIYAADIFVQPSRYEGKSVILNEAKMLSKPIVATNYATVKDQISHLHDGFICELNSRNLADTLALVLSDKQLQQKLISNLNNSNYDDEKHIKQYDTLFEC